VPKHDRISLSGSRRAGRWVPGLALSILVVKTKPSNSMFRLGNLTFLDSDIVSNWVVSYQARPLTAILRSPGPMFPAPRFRPHTSNSYNGFEILAHFLPILPRYSRAPASAIPALESGGRPVDFMARPMRNGIAPRLDPVEA